MKRGIGILLAGVLCAAMCIGLAGCKGQAQFYTLREAYEQELITYDDLKTFANEKSGAPDAQGRELSEESQAIVKAELIEHYDDLRGTLVRFEGDIDMSETLRPLISNQMEIGYYYGNFSGKDVFGVKFADSQFQVAWHITIADIEFYWAPNSWIIVWTNPDGIEF